MFQSEIDDFRVTVDIVSKLTRELEEAKQTIAKLESMLENAENEIISLEEELEESQREMDDREEYQRHQKV